MGLPLRKTSLLPLAVETALFCIGFLLEYEQWGTFEKCSVYVTYPIPFSAFVSVVGSIDSMDNEACQCRDVQLTKFLPWQKYASYQGKWMAVGR